MARTGNLTALPALSSSVETVNWSVFRLSGDFLHLAGMLFGLVTIYISRNVDGYSRKTQILYQLVFLTRYLDIFFYPQGFYLMFFKVTYNLITALMVLSFSIFSRTWDQGCDTCNIAAILLAANAAAFVTTRGATVAHDFWSFSEFLEPLALLPQYIMCYRAPRMRTSVLIYVVAVGGYRFLYVCHWIHKRLQLHTAYRDYISWSGGALECILFIDFLVRISRRQEVIGGIGASMLGQVLLQLDSSSGRLAEMVEMATIGRRIPLGLSGNGLQDEELAKRKWDVTDKINEEEGCSLLILNSDADGDADI